MHLKEILQALLLAVPDTGATTTTEWTTLPNRGQSIDNHINRGKRHFEFSGVFLLRCLFVSVAGFLVVDSFLG